MWTILSTQYIEYCVAKVFITVNISQCCDDQLAQGVLISTKFPHLLHLYFLHIKLQRHSSTQTSLLRDSPAERTKWLRSNPPENSTYLEPRSVQTVLVTR